MYVSCMHLNMSAQDTILPNAIHQIQHSTTIEHPGHLAFYKIYSRFDYNHSLSDTKPFGDFLSHMHYYNAEFSFSTKPVNIGLLYNYKVKRTTLTERYSGFISRKLFSGELSWIASCGFHFKTKKFQYKNMLFREYEPVISTSNEKQKNFLISFSNLLIYKKLFFSTSFSNTNMFQNGYVYNLLGYHFLFNNLQITPSIQYNWQIYYKELYYNVPYYAINLSAQYKQYLAGLGFDGTNFKIGTGYQANEKFLFNINYSKSIPHYVHSFKISLLYYY